MTSKLALGGGCHWCTEAVFQSLIGVANVEQGYVASVGDNADFHEAVIVHYDETILPSDVLIEIHINTHNSASDHSFRSKYRSAVYCYNEGQQVKISEVLAKLRVKYDHSLVTKALLFSAFKPSREQITNYYKKNPDKPFCKKYIVPKLQLLLEKYANRVVH